MMPTSNTQNFIVSYDLNGHTPTHAQVDDHIYLCSDEYGRILETVWYIRSSMTLAQLYEYMNRILSTNDRLLVVEAGNAWVRNLLVQTPSLQQAWAKAA